MRKSNKNAYICSGMEIKTRALVLRYIKYGDSSVIVDLFTESNGWQSLLMYVGTSRTQRVRLQMLRPLALVEILMVPNPRGGMGKLRGVSLLKPQLSIPNTESKLSISFFLAEFLSYALRDASCDVSLFNYIENSIEWLDNDNRSCANFHLVFLMHLTRFLGLYPNLDDGNKSDYFDLRDGCFTSLVPSHSDYLSKEESSKVLLLMRMDFKTMHLFTMNHHDRNRCVDILLYYYRQHLPGLPQLKSLDVLRELG